MIDAKQKEKLKEDFRNKLIKHIKLFNAAVSTQKGDWVVKGFIDIAKNIYTISADTKVVSKIMISFSQRYAPSLKRIHSEWFYAKSKIFTLI